MKEDYASLVEWFYENEETFIHPFIEQNYKQCSWQYEYWFMFRHITYTRAIIEDYRLSEKQKINELIMSVSHGKSKIIAVTGSRGSGKTGVALWLAEEARHNAGHKYIYYIGEPEHKEIYPPWFKFLKDIEDIPEGGFAVIDEAGIKYNARKYQQQSNKDLTDLMVIARHKSITMIFITQNLSIIDINIDRLLDMIIFKPGTDYGIRQKRGVMITKQQREHMIIMNRMKPVTKEECLLLYRSGAYPIYRKITNPLPSFWDDEKISKSFKSYKPSVNNTPKVVSQPQVIKQKSRIPMW